MRRRQRLCSSASRKIRTAAHTKRLRLALSSTTSVRHAPRYLRGIEGEREPEPLRLEVARHPQPLSQMLRRDLGVVSLHGLMSDGARRPALILGDAYEYLAGKFADITRRKNAGVLHARAAWCD